MRPLKFLLVLLPVFAISIYGQNSRHGGGEQVPACAGSKLTLRRIGDDAAMGGNRTIDYDLVNNGPAKCSLDGYPGYVLTTSSGKAIARGKAINAEQLPGEDQIHRPEPVVLRSGEGAWFRIYFNSGGAGHVGKPCPQSSKVRITIPGGGKTIVLNEQIQSCMTVQISSIRPGKPE